MSHSLVTPLPTALAAAPLLDLWQVSADEQSVSGCLPDGPVLLDLVTYSHVDDVSWAITSIGLVRLGGSLRAAQAAARIRSLRALVGGRP